VTVVTEGQMRLDDWDVKSEKSVIRIRLTE